jgi:hypothetical protein
MESPDFVIIPCRICYAKTIILGDRRRPIQCARCRAPYDSVSESFAPPASPSPERPPQSRDDPSSG